ncbi:putative serine protease K12H4.7 [Anopheles ziemanni]|uniref:putative serine protease K12H4.7 n=1 Tax=Anopheles coustani TaxID=139045 RepID=UPI00265A4F65|nr:putative serine protease K12H4.7 [Anopheles coustani]XP_058173735.1 putative serine protease K12H4.7 [Anopheles ziemanni]
MKFASSTGLKAAAVLLLAMIVVAAGKSVDKIRRPFPGIERMGSLLDTVRPPKGYVSQNPRMVEGRFTSRRNHFDPQDRNTFDFTYLYNDQFYREGGPLFLVPGGHYSINSFFMENGHFRDVAVMQGAMLATFEHRYYGNSIPVEDYSTENLRFLRTEQVLFDLIELVDFLKREVMNDPNARVILHGVAYAGTLASWARQRFPNIIDGAWVSSAPVRATVNFPEYYEDIGSFIREKASDQCYNRIFQAFHTAQNLLDAGETEMVSEMFNTCDPVNVEDPLEVELFFFAMMVSLELAMAEDLDVENIGRVCDRLTSDEFDTGLEALSAFLLDRYAEERECFDLSFENFVRYLTDVDIDSVANTEFGLRQSTYHDCTEFGLFPTTTSPDQPFGNRVTYDLFLAECQAAFGEFITQDLVYEAVRLTNFHYGADDPRTTNVLFTNGALDPLRHVSITSYQNLLSNARVTPREFAGVDIRSISGFDSEELLETKHMAEQYISSWLGSPISPFWK